jgi:hypothetical protein
MGDGREWRSSPLFVPPPSDVLLAVAVVHGPLACRFVTLICTLQIGLWVPALEHKQCRLTLSKTLHVPPLLLPSDKRLPHQSTYPKL